MICVNSDEPLWNYAGEKNYLVIPISEYIKRDGRLSIVGADATEALTRFPDLPIVWGYFVGRGIQAPTFRRRGINLIGGLERKHYASKPSPEVVRGSLYLLREAAEDSPDFLFYFNGPLGGEECFRHHEEILKSDRFIILRRPPGA